MRNNCSHHFKIIPVFLLLSLLLILSGCSVFFTSTIEIWTNRPEIASYVETFNAEHQEFRIEVVYKENPALSLLTEEELPDIVFSERLTSAAVIEKMKPLNRLFNKELLDPGIFYPRLLEYGKRESEQLLLPVSFTLPVLMFSAEGAASAPESQVLGMPQMRPLCEEFNDLETARPDSMGFITYQDRDFLYNFLQLEGAEFRETAGGQLAWNSTALRKGMDKLTEWRDNVNGGLERERYFTQHYLSSPGHKLLQDNTILYSSSTLQDFMDIAAEKRADIDFRWFGLEDKLNVSEELLYLGVLSHGRNRQTVETFLLWLFSSRNQQTLMEKARFKRINSFGFAGGFSSLQDVNERLIPRIYPEMAGKIPSEKLLRIPSPLPVDWDRLKNEVLLPYFTAECTTGSNDSLDKLLTNWYVKLQSSRQ